ncbi:MAG TPA: hypothetical protein VMV94_20335 [Phycisphaerae bacterium]|nr:hypothetical protein [Phycisphaerae bacterium]
MKADRPALYATVHPGVREYLADWYASVRAQTEQGFDLWLGVDGLELCDVKAAAKADVAAEWVLAADSDSPAAIRQKAIARIAERYRVVIFADSDDLLEPTRIAAAVEALETCDVVACAMRLIDATGRDLSSAFAPPQGADWSELLPRGNVFGLGNSAYRTAILRRCLPIPPDCRLVDWYLATLAWAMGAKLSFDRACGGAYRLHSGSMAVIRPPFTAGGILATTENVLNHYACVLGSAVGLPDSCLNRLEAARRDVQAFHAAIARDGEMLDRYVSALNDLRCDHVWWSCVAHPGLESIWRDSASRMRRGRTIPVGAKDKSRQHLTP